MKLLIKSGEVTLEVNQSVRNVRITAKSFVTFLFKSYPMLKICEACTMYNWGIASRQWRTPVWAKAISMQHHERLYPLWHRARMATHSWNSIETSAVLCVLVLAGGLMKLEGFFCLCYPKVQLQVTSNVKVIRQCETTWKDDVASTSSLKQESDRRGGGSGLCWGVAHMTFTRETRVRGSFWNLRHTRWLGAHLKGFCPKRQ